MLRINFGCGNNPVNGFVNMDRDKCNLEKLPLPFKTESVDEIRTYHVLEHVRVKPHEVMREFLRILKKDGVIRVNVPHFSWHNAFDEDHTWFF